MTCPTPITFTVYNGKDNVVILPVEGEDGAILSSLAAITRVTVTIGATTIDSAVVGSTVIWWTDSVAFRGSTVEAITLKLGGQSLTAGRYTDCYIVIYSAAYTNGKRIATPLTVTVEV